MKVTLIASTKLTDASSNEDMMPCLAARVSYGNDELKDPAKDIKLINFLATHLHTSPFEHLSATFKVECPIFVAREWMRHRTQSFNEISMRYTDKTIGQFFYPKSWRQQDTKNKQSSAADLPGCFQDVAHEIAKNAYYSSEESYKELIKLGVAREQARMVIPVGHYTEFYATANLLNWAKFVKLRTHESAQIEIQEIALQIKQHLLELFPESAKALLETKGEN